MTNSLKDTPIIQTIEAELGKLLGEKQRPGSTPLIMAWVTENWPKHSESQSPKRLGFVLDGSLHILEFVNGTFGLRKLPLNEASLKTDLALEFTHLDELIFLNSLDGCPKAQSQESSTEACALLTRPSSGGKPPSNS